MMHAGDGTRGSGVSGLAHGPTVDLMVDPVCQVALMQHFWGEVPEDLTQEPPDCVCDVTDTRVAYITDQSIGVDGYGVHHPTVNTQVQYAGRGLVLPDLYSDHPGVPGIRMPDAAAAFLGSTCKTAEAIPQVGTGVGKGPHPGMTICPVSHTHYNTIIGVIPEKMNSPSDQCGW